MVSGRLFSCRAVPVGSRGEMWQNIRAAVAVWAVYTILDKNLYNKTIAYERTLIKWQKEQKEKL